MSQALSKPTRLSTTQIAQASSLLGRAFQNDPLMIYVIPDAEKRRRLLPTLFRSAVSYCLRYGIIYTTPGLQGLVCCLPPGQAKMITRLALTSLESVPFGLGLSGLRRFLYTSKYTASAHKQAASGDHWYVWVLGVDPEQQGSGVGGQLLQTVLQQAREQNVPCYLDTQNPCNVPFYQKQGLHQVSQTQVPGSDVQVYAMLWEPDSTAS